MIKFIKGDLLKAEADALVNTVNTVGVMGKGIALQFKEAFPHNTKVYADACKKNELKTGQLLSVWDTNLLLGKKLIINFPTKIHWRNPSKYEYIETGLIALVELIQKENILSIALPPLGCGNGGLDWNIVKSMIKKHLEPLSLIVLVYEPNAEIKSELQKQEKKADVKLTTARAQLMYALFTYESYGEYSSLFAANKLAYFLQRMGQPLKLKFEPHYYGPYAIAVSKVLYAMNGVYLKGLEQQEVKPFDPLLLNYEKWSEIKEYCEKQMNNEDFNRLINLLQMFSGFTSELSLEILSSTAYILDDHPDYTFEQVLQAIKQWSPRKAKLFKEEYVRTAFNHLISYQENIVFG